MSCCHAVDECRTGHTTQLACWAVCATFLLYPSQSDVLFFLCHYSYTQIFVTFTVCLCLVSLHLNICLLPRFPIITSHLQGPLLRRASHFRPHCDNRYLWHSLPGLLQSTPALLYLFPLALTRFSPPISTTVPCLNVSNTFLTLPFLCIVYIKQ